MPGHGLGLGLTSQRRRASAWNPGLLPGTPREWLAGPDWCYTDGSAAFASASSQYLNVASNSTLQTGDVDFWVAGWFNLTSNAGPRGVVTKTPYTTSFAEFQLWNNSGTLYFDTLDSSAPVVGRVSASTPTAGTWVFVVAYQSVASNQVGLSINGGAFTTATRTGVPTTNASAFTIGAFPGGAYSGGNIASVAFGKSPPGGIASVISTISSRLYASGAGIVYADTTAAERTDWGLVSWWDLVRSGVFTDSHGTNNLTNNNGVTFGAGLPRARAGDTDPISAWVDRWQGTTVSQSDPLKRPTLRLVNGKWVVRFDGVNDGMFYSGSVYASQPVTFGYAANPTNVTAGYRNVFDTYTGFRLLSGTSALAAWRLYAGGTVEGGTYATGWATVTGLANGGTGSVLRKNGGQIAAGNPGAYAMSTGVVIGNDYALTNAQAWEGDIASVVLTGADASAEFARLEAYLGGLY